ncbi:MAG: sulfur oxidation c-type cytochrome SoxA [Enterobacterales bacterium]|nr:sulfur oxidation c-type cytochrome SoxA [Enterobacterales bacterium]
MKTKITWCLAIISIMILSACSDSETLKGDTEVQPAVQASTVNYQQKVNQDVKRFREFFASKFPNIELEEFVNGAYAIDAATREQWLEIEEFPPYEIPVEEGQEFFEAPFANGKTYADCFENGGIGIRQNFPYFDEKTNQVITLELAINQCREANGEQPLDYGQGELASISAYMANESRDNVFDIKVNSEAAYKAYMAGKQFFYSKRGQLNFACADCHLKISGSLLRADILSPAIGHPTGMPVYRSNWGELGTIGHRYRECNKNVRAEPLDYQSESYRNLEFYQTVMSNGLVVNGPSSRK